ncbi:MAG: hypothetical protein OXU20_40525 [Myxococcales bacterium]|nr:hypothetical protein [Myxococcales bacterium]MDD9969910.1 hypothetical protein [Myxococcales bacterium]
MTQPPESERTQTPQAGSQAEVPRGEDKRWLDEHKNVDKVFYALVGVCALLALADFGYHKHAHFSFEGVHAFHGLFGFLAYFGLVLTATQLRKLLKRDENYYD